jgi:hypothetical protein
VLLPVSLDRCFEWAAQAPDFTGWSKNTDLEAIFLQVMFAAAKPWPTYASSSMATKKFLYFPFSIAVILYSS